MCILISLVNTFLVGLLPMAAKSKEYNRGKQIHYDQIPDDVYEIIIRTQASIKLRTGRARVSLSQAITKLIRTSKQEG